MVDEYQPLLYCYVVGCATTAAATMHAMHMRALYMLVNAVQDSCAPQALPAGWSTNTQHNSHEELRSL
jgi:hypothetical protein